MSIKEYLSSNPFFHPEEGLFLQHDFPIENVFEQSYLSLREKEGRLYEDGIVKRMPFVDSHHPRSHEWKIRRISTDKLIQYLRKKNVRSILEIGCGNGWLTHYLAQQTLCDCLGIDINITELRQAVRVFQSEKVNFGYIDILSDALIDLRPDVILLPSCLQYFADAPGLLRHLLKIVHPEGEIHVLDTPIYNSIAVDAAKKRSLKYFSDQGGLSMKDYYHHHDWGVFDGIRFEVLYDPSSWWNKIRSKITITSPFTWIRIRAHRNRADRNRSSPVH